MREEDSLSMLEYALEGWIKHHATLSDEKSKALVREKINRISRKIEIANAYFDRRITEKPYWLIA